jgi:ribosomal protein L24
MNIQIGDSVSIIAGKDAGLAGVVEEKEDNWLLIRRRPSRFGEKIHVKVENVKKVA